MRLETAALDYGYPGRAVGRGMDLTLAEGEVLCVLGPNGAGKSTLFRTVLGLLAPLAGRVSVGGRDLASLSRAEIARELAYVPQASASHFDFSLQEVAEMGRAAHLGPFQRPAKRDRDIARAALERMGVGKLADRPLSAVSGGERQLALIARALATDARAIVMDEPPASLDFGNQARVLDEVRALAASGIGVIMATHDPDQAFLCADLVALLHEGRLARLGPPADVITPATLARTYGVEVEIVTVTRDGGPVRVCLPSLAMSRPTS